MYAHEIYGGPAPVQPNPSAAALGVAAGGDLAVRTPGPEGSRPRILQNPTLVLVALLGLAALLINFSVKLEVSG